MNNNQFKVLKYIIIVIFITAYTSLAQNNNLMNLNAFDSLNKNAEIARQAFLHTFGHWRNSCACLALFLRSVNLRHFPALPDKRPYKSPLPRLRNSARNARAAPRRLEGGIVAKYPRRNFYPDIAYNILLSKIF